MRLIFMIITWVLILAITSCSKDKVPSVLPGSDEIEMAIKSANDKAKLADSEVMTLTRSHFDSWFIDFVKFVPLKQDRTGMADAIRNNKLPSDNTIVFQNNSADYLPSSIQYEPFNLPIVEGSKASTFLEWSRNLMMQTAGSLALAKEPFQGPIPSREPPVLDMDIQIRTTEIEVPGACLIAGYEERDALKVEVLVTPKNQEELSNWFGTGFNRAAMKIRIKQLLGSQVEAWLNVKDFFPNWLRNKINTFPVDGDNEVCHGAAREFYYKEQESSLNASTEATIIMLSDYYCEISDPGTMVFGDYLYVPGQHSGRFLLRDAQSGRDIGFSVQSGGIGAYRFWWMDEDFSGDPFGHKPMADVFSKRVDIWRRCK